MVHFRPPVDGGGGGGPEPPQPPGQFDGSTVNSDGRYQRQNFETFIKVTHYFLNFTLQGSYYFIPEER